MAETATAGGPVREAGLDRLRACAALAVIVAHGGYFLYPVLPVYDAYALASWLGTEVFFALSGFLVVWALGARFVAQAGRGAGGAADLRIASGFVLHRLWRIVPLYWLFLALNLALAAYDGRGWPPSVGAYAVLAQNLATPHPAFFGEAWNLPLLLLASLALPGLVLGARALRDPLRALGMMLVVLVLVGIVLRAAWVIEYQPRWDEGVRKLVVTRIDACFYGALAAVIVLRLGRAPRRVAACIALAGLVIAAALFLGLPRDTSHAARVCAFLAAGIGSAALVVASLGAAPRVSRAVAALARWSYALYLVNMPMIFAMAALGWGQSQAPLTALSRFACWLVATLALSAAVHRWIERPLLALRRDRGPG